MLGSVAHRTLATALMLQGEDADARAEVEAACALSDPRGDHLNRSLLGLIALRQKDREAARGAFAEAVKRADAAIERTAALYEAHEARGLALSGLALCEGSRERADGAIAAYRRAREITTAPGLVARALRLFDALAVADADGLLAGVREAVAGRT